MKRLAKNLVAASTLFIAGSASAGWNYCVNPVVGVDYYQARMNATGGFRGIFPMSVYSGVTAYVAARFSDCWGLELGYDNSAKPTRTFILNDAGQFATISTVSGTSKVRRSGGHLDLIGYWPVACLDCFELFGSVGYGYLKPSVSVTTFSNTGTRGPIGAASVQTLHGRSSSVFRAGLGGNYMISDCIGIRAKFGYEITSSLKIDRTTVSVSGPIAAGGTITLPGGTNKAFKNSSTLALGLFAKF